MSLVPKSGLGPGPISKTPPANCRLSGDLYAGEHIDPADTCYIKADGTVWRSNGTTANDPSAKSRGFAPQSYEIGEAVTLFRHVNFDYSNGQLTPGQNLYVGTTPGSLDSAPTAGGTNPVAFAVDTCRIHVLGSNY